MGLTIWFGITLRAVSKRCTVNVFGWLSKKKAIQFEKPNKNDQSKVTTLSLLMISPCMKHAN